MLHQDRASGASGVLKLNSKMLQPSDLRKLDKLEKSLLVEMGRIGKGEIDYLDALTPLALGVKIEQP